MWTELLSIFVWWSAHMRLELGTQITPWGWIFWTLLFYNFKKFTSRSIWWEVKLFCEITRSWSLSYSNIAIFYHGNLLSRFKVTLLLLLFFWTIMKAVTDLHVISYWEGTRNYKSSVNFIKPFIWRVEVQCEVFLFECLPTFAGSPKWSLLPVSSTSTLPFNRHSHVATFFFDFVEN